MAQAKRDPRDRDVVKGVGDDILRQTQGGILTWIMLA